MSMSGDEVLILVVALGVAFSCWGVWIVTAVKSIRFGRGVGQLISLLLAFAASLGTVFAALVTVADPQVRFGGEYIVLFLLIAADALAAVSILGSMLGLSALDGVIRRRNGAALAAVTGLWLGTGLINAGANAGRGDTIYTTLGPLALALATYLVLIAMLSAATRGFRAVRLDRDGPAGVRLAGLLVAWGLILGRAVAGDWESTSRTLHDFGRFAAGAALLLLGGGLVEAALRPTVRRPHRSWLWGIGPAAAYVIPCIAIALP